MSEYQYYEFQTVDRSLTNDWDKIESLVIEKKATSYDKAVELLIDLRDLAVRDDSRNFLKKLNELKQRHSAKSSFIARLQRIG